MAQNPPVWMQAGTYNAEADRLVTALLFDRNLNDDGTFRGVEGGVVPPKDQLSQFAVGGTSMQVDIHKGLAIIPAKSDDPPGVYVCYNTGPETLTFSIAGGQPRFDLIIAEVQDTAVGDAADRWRFRVVQGSPGPNPTAPDPPNGSIAIARVNIIPSAQNGGQNKITGGQIYDMRRFTASLGGVHLTWKENPNPRMSPGRLLYDVSNKSLYVSDGTSWSPVYSFDEWRNYFAAYRPQQAQLANNVYALTPAEEWISKPKDTGTNNPIGTDVSVTKVATPSGRIKVSLMAFGKVDPDVGGQSTSGHMSVLVKRVDNGNTLFDPVTARGLSFYTKAFQHTGVTFMLVGLPTDADMNVILQFTRRDAAGRATFAQAVLLVEPVI